MDEQKYRNEKEMDGNKSGVHVYANESWGKNWDVVIKCCFNNKCKISIFS